MHILLCILLLSWAINVFIAKILGVSFLFGYLACRFELDLFVIFSICPLAIKLLCISSNLGIFTKQITVNNTILCLQLMK